jgi:S1-C subfamily serine protease
VLNSFLLILLIFITALFGEQTHNDYLNTKRADIVMLTNLERTSGGTGFYVKTPSGKIVTMTNGHVCRLATNGIIILDDGNIREPVSVLAQYENNDLCIVEAPRSITSGLSVARSVREGEDIYILGHPMLEPKSLVKGQISGKALVSILQNGELSCLGKTYKKIPPNPNDILSILLHIEFLCVRTTEAVYVTANILPGNSGSPVLNMWGHVVGVAFAGTPGSARGLIVPLSDVKEFLKDK